MNMQDITKQIQNLLDQHQYDEALELLQASEPSAEVDALKEQIDTQRRTHQASLIAIRDYFVSNQKRYTHNALVDKLQDAGYSAAEISEAIEKYNLAHPLADGNPDNMEELIEIIRRERASVPRSQLTHKLIERGYLKEDIDTAYQALLENHHGNPGGTSTNPVSFLIVFPGLPLVVFLLSRLDVTLATVTLFAGIIAGLFTPFMIRDRYPDVAKGIVYGFRTLVVIFFVIPAVGLLVLTGICIVMGVQV
jgi:DNA-binding transcriptional MerR regulator